MKPLVLLLSVTVIVFSIVGMTDIAYAGQGGSSQVRPSIVTTFGDADYPVILGHEPRPPRGGRPIMRFNAPTQVTFFIALVLAILAVVSRFVAIPNLTPNAFWILLIAYVVLVIGCVYRRR